LLAAIDHVMQNKNEIRAKDTIGNLLWFHLHRSTEYLSKYILLKISMNESFQKSKDKNQVSIQSEPSPSSSPQTSQSSSEATQLRM
jgi:hypothetical protein